MEVSSESDYSCAQSVVLRTWTRIMIIRTTRAMRTAGDVEAAGESRGRGGKSIRVRQARRKGAFCQSNQGVLVSPTKSVVVGLPS